MDLLERTRQVVQERQAKYGHVIEHHAATALVWTAILRRRGLIAPDASLEASDISLLFAGDKLIRESFEAYHDNRIDICGYMDRREAILTTQESEMDEAQARGILRKVPA